MCSLSGHPPLRARRGRVVGRGAALALTLRLWAMHIYLSWSERGRWGIGKGGGRAARKQARWSLHSRDEESGCGCGLGCERAEDVIVSNPCVHHPLSASSSWSQTTTQAAAYVHAHVDGLVDPLRWVHLELNSHCNVLSRTATCPASHSRCWSRPPSPTSGSPSTCRSPTRLCLAFPTAAPSNRSLPAAVS